jgi:hypothetical protein
MKLRNCGCLLIILGVVGLIAPLFGYVLTIRHGEVNSSLAIIGIVIGAIFMFLDWKATKQ